MSMGPWPMAAVLVQVPTSDFIRSNSGEAGLGLADSAALSHSAVASSSVVQRVVVFVFMVVVRFLVICFTFINTTNGPGRSGQRPALFGKESRGPFRILKVGDEGLVYSVPFFSRRSSCRAFKERVICPISRAPFQPM